MSTIKLIAINALLLLSMATSCIKGQLLRVQYQFSSCPSKEFVLPISELEKGIKFIWLEGTTEYEYERLSKREGREWMSPNLKTYIEYGDRCTFNIITWVSDASRAANLDKKDALAIANKKIEALNEFVKSLFRENKFEINIPPKIEFIDRKEFEHIQKDIQKKMSSKGKE